MTAPPRLLILDASCLLNLYATGFLRHIAATLPYQFAVAEYVLEQEALYIWHPESDETHKERVTVDLSQLVSDGMIHVMRLEHYEEEVTFVDLAIAMDDGEATTGALAFHRDFSVATDDRKARRVLSEQFPTVPLVSTLELLNQWAQEESVSDVEMQAAMMRMRTGASYAPGHRDPLYEWWLQVIHGIT